MSRAPGPAVVVVDASLAAAWVLREPYSGLALALADDWASAGVETIAPGLMFTEVTSAIYKRVRRGELSLDDAREALDVALAFGVRLEHELDLHRKALVLAHRLNRPTPYDAHYLALAELRGCELWTADERLYNAVRFEFPWVRWIGEHTAAGG